MSFGGIGGILPLRLGGSSDTSTAPEEWLRLAVDAALVSAPLCSILVTAPAVTGACTVTGFSRAGIDSATGITAVATVGAFSTDVAIELGDYYTEPTTSAIVQWIPRTAFAVTVGGVAPSISWSISGSVITVSYDTTGPFIDQISVGVWGETSPRHAGDYGGDANKAQSAEGDTPYAWTWLQEVQGIRGDAFSTAAGSFTQMENIAIARQIALLQRAAERHVSNQFPECSDQALPRWLQLLGLGSSEQGDWALRAKAQAMFALVISGPTAAALDAACQAVFGGNFVQIHRFAGTLDSPPAGTYWPGGDTGPGALTVRRSVGPWSSRRYHYLVELSADSAADEVRLLSLAHGDMDEIFTAALPPVNTWAYNFNGLDGFEIGISRLGRDSL